MNAANKAWYWLAAGVLALGLNGYYHDGGLQGLHRLAERGTTVAAETTGQFRQIEALAEVTMPRHAHLRCERPAPPQVVVFPAAIPPQAQARLAHLQERLGEMQAVRLQTRMARLQQVIARRDLRCAQVDFRNGRIEVLTNQDHARAVLPPLPHVEVSGPQQTVVELPEPN